MHSVATGYAIRAGRVALCGKELLHTRVLALHVHAARGGKTCQDRRRLPADEEGRSFNLDAVKKHSPFS